jgi:hypothetical protein
MCFGGNDGSDEAERARQEEQQRQQKIRYGTSRINSIFDGGSPIQAIDNAQKKAIRSGKQPGELVDENGNPYTGGRGYLKEAPIAGAFTNDFFKGRRDAYTSYATPQLEDQYGKTQKELIFSLDRSGNLDSSARGEKVADLQKLYDIQKQGVADKALSYENQSRNSVEDARANLIATLNATGDAEGAAKSALARADILSAPTEYSPLGQLFTDFTSGLGIQAAQERSFAAGGPKPTYNTGLFSNRGRTTVSG